MSELKTLKDFERSDFNEREEFSIGTIAGNNNLINELKAEAVKIIRFLDKASHHELCKFCSKLGLVTSAGISQLYGFRKGLIWQNNITEEDLKEVQNE